MTPDDASRRLSTTEDCEAALLEVRGEAAFFTALYDLCRATPEPGEQNHSPPTPTDMHELAEASGWCSVPVPVGLPSMRTYAPPPPVREFVDRAANLLGYGDSHPERLFSLNVIRTWTDGPRVRVASTGGIAVPRVPATPVDTRFIAILHGAPVGADLYHDAATLHELWAQQPEPGPHPLSPLVRAYLRRPLPVQPETRRDVITPGTLAGMVATPPREPITGDERLPMLLDDLGDLGPSQAVLPGLAHESVVVESLPLPLYDATGAPMDRKGSGAPYELRLWFGAVLSVPTTARGGPVRVELTLRDYVRMLGVKYRRGEHLPRIREALWAVHNMRVAYQRRDWCIVSVPALPRPDARLDDEVPLCIELPPGSERGPMIDRVTLQRLGAKSTPAFRAWIRLAYFWNKFGTGGGGRIRATRPILARNDDGHMLDSESRVILTKHDKPETQWSHPRAVRLDGEEHNPAADRIPVLIDADLVALCYDNREVSPTTYRERLSRARKALQKMETAGHLVIERGVIDKKGRRGWRVLEPRRKADGQPTE